MGVIIHLVTGGKNLPVGTNAQSHAGVAQLQLQLKLQFQLDYRTIQPDADDPGSCTEISLDQTIIRQQEGENAIQFHYSSFGLKN